MAQVKAISDKDAELQAFIDDVDVLYVLLMCSKNANLS